MQPTYYTSRDLAAAWTATLPRPVHHRTIDNWRFLGRGPAWVKVGGRVLYERGAVEAWVAAGGLIKRVNR